VYDVGYIESSNALTLNPVAEITEQHITAAETIEIIFFFIIIPPE
jgi:hypothetical protein